MLDVLIRNAQVHDGSGEKSSQVDVGVRDGSIVAVGKTEEPAPIAFISAMRAMAFTSSHTGCARPAHSLWRRVRRLTSDPATNGTRMLRDPLGAHGLWVNGVRVFDGQKLTSPERGPGQVLRRFER